MQLSRCLLPLTLVIFALPANATPIRYGDICFVSTTGTITRADGTVVDLTTDAELFVGDRVRTGNSGTIQYTVENTHFTVGANSDFIVDRFSLTPAPKPSLVARLLRGTMRVITNIFPSLEPSPPFNIWIRSYTHGIRGTTAEVSVDELGRSEVALFEGGPVDIGQIQDWSTFDDALFSDPSDKGLLTMDIAAFAAQALLQNMTLDEFLVGPNPAYQLTAPLTALSFDGDTVLGPYPAIAAGFGRPCPNCISEPASIALFGIGLAGVIGMRGRAAGKAARGSDACAG
ncbi:MAG: FecR domain-containing protein [Gammaproteobacteria bacterium]|nr:FecR domain-containing protein [Gammaproteobacteria bacterium]